LDTVFVILQSSQRSQILHKKISTHLLTLLIMSVILHLEQRKGNKKNRRCRKRNRSSQKAFLWTR